MTLSVALFLALAFVFVAAAFVAGMAFAAWTDQQLKRPPSTRTRWDDMRDIDARAERLEKSLKRPHEADRK